MTQDRDIGTPQRHAKGHRIVDYQPLRDGKDGYQQKAGELVALVLEECSLDVLYHRDLLGKDKDRRYAAGLWLRELYLKTHPSTTVSAYHDAASRSADISSNTTDAQSWNLKVWLETQKAMGEHWPPLEHICVLDRPCIAIWPELHDALDVLADHRHI